MFKVDFKEKHDAFVQLIKSNNLLEELTALKKSIIWRENGRIILRPGEKLYEELLINPNNNYTKTKNKKIYIEKETPIKKEQLKLKYVIDNFELQNNDELKVILSKIIKTYKIDGDNNANT